MIRSGDQVTKGGGRLMFAMLCLAPFSFFLRALSLPLLAGVSRLRLDLSLKILALSIVPVSILATKRLVYSGYEPAVIADLALWLIVVLFLSGARIDSRIANKVLFFLVAAFFLNYPLLLFFDNPLLWYLIHGGDATDLTKGLFFRNPGIFNEPSTYCYIAIIAFLYSSRSTLQTCLLSLTCVMSTSIGGILAVACVLIVMLTWRQLILVIILGTIGVTGFLLSFEDGGYIGERMIAILDGSDGSANARFSTLSQVTFTLFGMDIQAIKSLYELSTVKSVGFISNVFINLGALGLVWLVMLMILIPQPNLLARIALLAFMKFDLLSAPAWLLLLCVRANGKE